VHASVRARHDGFPAAPAEHADRNRPLLPSMRATTHHRCRYSPTTVDERWWDGTVEHALLPHGAARRNGAGGARSPPAIPAATCTAVNLIDACNSTCSSITRANDVISHHLLASALQLCIVHCVYAMADSALQRPLPAAACRCVHCSNANNRPQIHSQLRQTSAFGDSTSSMRICMTSVHASVHARHDGFPATPAKHADHCGPQQKNASRRMSDPAPPMAVFFRHNQ
jgi:hypothetical protein